MLPTPASVVQTGFPSFLPDLLGLAAMLVLVLILVAIGGFVYRQLTGGVEWPDERENDDSVKRGEDDDEWDFY